MRPFIVYTDGWKYQLKDACVCQTGICPAERVETDYITLELDGLLTVKAGYAWDGPSGPAVDSKNFMRGSLIHDAFYQLLREKRLPAEARDKADRLLQRLCVEDGMWKVRAWWVYQGVSRFAESAAGKAGRHPVIYAPEKPKRELEK